MNVIHPTLKKEMKRKSITKDNKVEKNLKVEVFPWDRNHVLGEDWQGGEGAGAGKYTQPKEKWD